MFMLLPKTEAYLKHAMRELHGFDWEGDYRPRARAAIKALLEGELQREVAAEVGVEAYVRGEERRDWRNGSYFRHLLTEVGDLELAVPRRRRGGMAFQSLRRYQKRAKTIDRAILGCFVYGLSTRKVGEALGTILGEKPSSSTVSRIAKELDQAVAAYHRRPLLDQYRFLFFDGVVLKRRRPLGEQRRVFLCAYGIRWNGLPEMIEFYQAQGESQNAWEAFLRDLYERGLIGKNTQLVITDGSQGLHAALAVVYPRIPRQRCWAHKVRNVLDKVRVKDQPALKRTLAKIWGAKNLKAATQAYWRLASSWRTSYPAAVACLERDLDELLAFFAIPLPALWSKIRTTNPIERAFREVKRRTRPMGVFTNKESMERIVYALFAFLNRSWSKGPL